MRILLKYPGDVWLDAGDVGFEAKCSGWFDWKKFWFGFRLILSSRA